MKVLFFVSGLYGGGAERIATYIANHMSKTDTIHIATFNKGEKTYYLEEGISIHNINPRISFPLFKVFKPAVRYINIWQIISKVNPDIIVSFSVSMNYLVLLVNRITKKKIIVSERTSLSRFISKKAEYARNKLYQLADQVVLLSKEDYEKASHLKNKIVIYNPLHFEKYTLDTERENSIVAIGSTARWNVKGFDMLIKAWKIIADKNKSWTLEFIGKNNDPYIDNLIKENELCDRVRFLGHKDDLDKELRKKSIYVLSSRYEGFPNSLSEAMSQGCACIAFNCSTGPKEIITDMKSGLLVEEKNIKELANKLDLLINNPLLRKRLSNGALKDVDRFDSEKILKEWRDIIIKIATCE